MTSAKIALITGANRPHGLGVAVARELAPQGFHMVLAGRDLDQTRLRAQELAADGLSTSAVRVELNDQSTIIAAAAWLGSEYGRLDALVHNAALPRPVGAPAYSMAKFTADAFTTSLAVELRDAGILVNSVDPGQFASHPEQGDDNDGRPTVESARWVAWAATLPAGGPTGMLFEDGERVGL